MPPKYRVFCDFTLSPCYDGGKEAEDEDILETDDLTEAICYFALLYSSAQSLGVKPLTVIETDGVKATEPTFDQFLEVILDLDNG